MANYITSLHLKTDAVCPVFRFECPSFPLLERKKRVKELNNNSNNNNNKNGEIPSNADSSIKSAKCQMPKVKVTSKLQGRERARESKRERERSSETAREQEREKSLLPLCSSFKVLCVFFDFSVNISSN